MSSPLQNNFWHNSTLLDVLLIEGTIVDCIICCPGWASNRCLEKIVNVMSQALVFLDKSSVSGIEFGISFSFGTQAYCCMLIKNSDSFFVGWRS